MDKIVKHDYLGMFNEQLNQRFLFNYPPYTRLIKIVLKHKNLEKLVKASSWLSDALKNYYGDQLLGPESPIIPRINNRYIKALRENQKKYLERFFSLQSRLLSLQQLDEKRTLMQ